VGGANILAANGHESIATPLNFGEPEREARKCMPRDLYE
jgi:hypothetical protein